MIVGRNVRSAKLRAHGEERPIFSAHAPVRAGRTYMVSLDTATEWDEDPTDAVLRLRYTLQAHEVQQRMAGVEPTLSSPLLCCAVSRGRRDGYSSPVRALAFGTCSETGTLAVLATLDPSDGHGSVRLSARYSALMIEDITDAIGIVSRITATD